MAPYSPPIAHYAHIAVSDNDVKHLPMLIGKEGKRFKFWTKKYNLQYIWYNSQQQCIELWGPFHSFETGCKDAIENEITEILMKNHR